MFHIPIEYTLDMSAVYLRRNTGQHSIFAFGRIIFIDETIPCHYSMGGKYRTLRYYRTSVNPAVFTDVYLSVGTMYYPCINILHVMEISKPYSSSLSAYRLQS